MKKIFFLLISLSIFTATTQLASAQQDVLKNEKNDEVIIRKKGDNNAKVIIEINDDNVLVNGKPLSDFNDSNITVIKRNLKTRNDNDMMISPRSGNSFYFNNDGETRPLLGVKTKRTDIGVSITDVAKGSAADKAGLKEGDIITKAGTKNIEDPEDLVDAVNLYKPGAELKVYYKRNGKASDTKAILGERKEGGMKTFGFNKDKMPRMNEDFMQDFNLQVPPVPSMPDQSLFNLLKLSNKKLGIKIEDTDNDSGAKVSNVQEGSVAAKAGLKKDDIITEVDGQKVKNTEDVRERVMDNEKNSYTMKAKRGTSDLSFEIKIPKKMNSADL